MSKATSSFPNVSHHGLHMFPPATEYLVSLPPSLEANPGSRSSSHTSSSSLLYYLSVLKDKVSQVQTLVGVLASSEQSLPELNSSVVISSMNSTIQEIIVAATSMRLNCQHMALGSTVQGSATTTCNEELHSHHHQQSHDHDMLLLPRQSNFDNNIRGVVSNIGQEIARGQSFFSSPEAEALDWFAESYNNNNSTNSNCDPTDGDGCVGINDEARGRLMSQGGDETDIIELDAADMLARYTHFCQICGKGFKRDANLRMHMRAHGDEYKTSAALKNNKGMLLLSGVMKPSKYSCPQEGCRWNKKHARFQPLKSMVCAKNHYKRSHCPKMYVCKRCNQKQFSVLSDLRTHEKHCGDPKWVCSCGTTFSRKDKLMGHVALFVGHTPAVSGLSHSGRSEQQALQQQIEGSSG